MIAFVAVKVYLYNTSHTVAAAVAAVGDAVLHDRIRVCCGVSLLMKAIKKFQKNINWLVIIYLFFLFFTRCRQKLHALTNFDDDCVVGRCDFV